MAADIYLRIDGVNGESNDDKHNGWIEVVAADWGVTQPAVLDGAPCYESSVGRS